MSLCGVWCVPVVGGGGGEQVHLVEDHHVGVLQGDTGRGREYDIIFKITYTYIHI